MIAGSILGGIRLQAYFKQREQARLRLLAQQRRLAEEQRIRQEFHDLQEECRIYSAPADQVIYEDDPAAVGKLLASRKGYEPGWPSNAPTSAYLVPHCWRSLAHWAVYPDADCPAGFLTRDAGTAFLHGRTAPDGTARIIRVELAIITGHVLVLKPLVVRFDRFDQFGRGISPTTNPHHLGIFLHADDRLRVFAGQPDPADASHFTIAYQLNGRAGMIDGWMENADSVRLKPREGWVDEDRKIALWFPPASLNFPATRPSHVNWP